MCFVCKQAECLQSWADLQRELLQQSPDEALMGGQQQQQHVQSVQQAVRDAYAAGLEAYKQVCVCAFSGGGGVVGWCDGVGSYGGGARVLTQKGNVKQTSGCVHSTNSVLQPPVVLVGQHLPAQPPQLNTVLCRAVLHLFIKHTSCRCHQQQAAPPSVLMQQ